MYNLALSCLTYVSGWCLTWHNRVWQVYHCDVWRGIILSVVCHRAVWSGIIVSDTYIFVNYEVRLSCLTLIWDIPLLCIYFTKLTYGIFQTFNVSILKPADFVPHNLFCLHLLSDLFIYFRRLPKSWNKIRWLAANCLNTWTFVFLYGWHVHRSQ